MQDGVEDDENVEGTDDAKDDHILLMEEETWHDESWKHTIQIYHMQHQPHTST